MRPIQHSNAVKLKYLARFSSSDASDDEWLRKLHSKGQLQNDAGQFALAHKRIRLVAFQTPRRPRRRISYSAHRHSKGHCKMLWTFSQAASQNKKRRACDAIFIFNAHTTKYILIAAEMASVAAMGTPVAYQSVVIILVIKTVMMIARAKEHKRETPLGHCYAGWRNNLNNLHL